MYIHNYSILLYYRIHGVYKPTTGGPSPCWHFFGDIPWFDAQVQHAEDAENLRQGPKDVAGKSQW